MNEERNLRTIDSLLEGCWPGEWGQEPAPGNGNAIVYRSTDMDNSGNLNEEGGSERIIDAAKRKSKALQEGDILLEASGGTPDRPVGRVALYQGLRREPCIVSNFLRTLRPNRSVNTKYLLRQLLQLQKSSSIWKYQQQTTGIINLKFADYLKHKIWVPERHVQDGIATVGETLDSAIEKTEFLITKYQKIKAGLMHDLFTCGVTPDGKLRPPREQAPELYHETPIGWVPKEWDINCLDSVAESLVDGPFGSNLKTEHYVVDPGIRVVRLQNIQATVYNDNDRAYIAEKHASFLVRNKVISGDILIAGLGEERYPVGRACLYPENLPPAINKADCFRLRCNIQLALNSFVMAYLNTSTARQQIVRYEQGVTRPRINLGNIKKVMLPMPGLVEQELIWERLRKASEQLDVLESEKLKLLSQKKGLMHDLLTGKVRVHAESRNPEMIGG